MDGVTCKGCTKSESWIYLHRNGFPKKLLVAISIVAIITMCITPTEARAMVHKRRHHRRHPESMALRLGTKENLTRRSEDNDTLLYKTSMKKIIKKLRNVRRFFSEEQKVLRTWRQYKFGNPQWLPKINFINIHEHKYRTPKNNGTKLLQRRMAFLLPRLYKFLMDYQAIFKRLLTVSVESTDDDLNNYTYVRHDLLINTTNRLFTIIDDVRDSMNAVKIDIPEYKQSPTLKELELKVDGTKCIKNDYIAFRGYGNQLTSWYCELKCPKSKEKTDKTKLCVECRNILNRKDVRRRIVH